LLLIFGLEAINQTDKDGNHPIHYALKHDPKLLSNIIGQMVQINPLMLIQPARNKPGDPEYLPMFYTLCDHNDLTICVLVECYPMPRNVYGSQREIATVSSLQIQKIKNHSYFIEEYPEAAHIHNKNVKITSSLCFCKFVHYLQTIQQLVLAWPQSSFKFCPKTDKSNEDDINNFEENLC